MSPSLDVRPKPGKIENKSLLSSSHQSHCSGLPILVQQAPSFNDFTDTTQCASEIGGGNLRIVRGLAGGQDIDIGLQASMQAFQTFFRKPPAIAGCHHPRINPFGKNSPLFYSTQLVLNVYQVE
jgi:hypothetical protein